ncbi:type I restriction enzyme HsdR N-terminal domain-containing protein [Rhodohalobacter sp. 8-1]|uniref:type I restriction enzyme HsdR N-terminal domain-containing protein n=1 Tax=Rhodohalobacter sp. 8-1 TaxID=3131972 RepID=UPI0030ED7F53
MRSQATGHFPQVRFSDARKWLYNPILKKRFANRPEERVRLQYVEFLLHQTTVSPNRIGFEAPVKTESAENTLRADLVIYDRDMAPYVLIECKSGRIKLNAKTAEQTARYNRTLQADFLMITNGTDDFWYQCDGQKISPLQNHPFDLKPQETEPVNPTDYWIKRGFVDTSLTEPITESAGKFLNSVFAPPEPADITYLNLPEDISTFSLDHFYRIYKSDTGDSLALSLIADSSNQTVLSAVLNQDGQNRGVLWVPLAKIFSTASPEAIRLTPGGRSVIQFPEVARSLMTAPSRSNIKKLVNHLINLFD